MTAAPLRIMVTGLRGIPHVQGGVETHAAELYARLAKLGAEVTVIGRKSHRPRNIGDHWNGIRLHWLWSPGGRGFEAAIHTILAVLCAGIRRPDVLHIHAVGPSIAVPLAKILGLRVVVTHHGQDYLREKWRGPEKALIRLGELFAVRFSDALISVSSSVQAALRAQHGREATWIPNGVSAQPMPAGNALLDKYQLTRQHYVVQVSRLVPEKRQLDLIHAFRAAQLPGWKLVLVGGAPASDPYAAAVHALAAGDDSIVCTGTLAAPEAHELLAGAGAFVLPSSHEGLPIALLEAIAYGVPSLASDIPGNREIGLDAEGYFAVGDTETLAARLRTLASSADARATAVSRYAEIRSRFDWDEIAQSTIAVMESAARMPWRLRFRARVPGAAKSAISRAVAASSTRAN
ncbi:MAG TPA: glycosyltransferase family 4 protein [Steroidobacteraceae bacterium]|nr:glycosyltransferase family 4 protein [Steroidobacteraceae bacterium]